MTFINRLRTLFISLGFALLSKTPLLACTVCFGGVDSDLSRGFYWGIMLLLLLPFAIISVLAGLIIHHTRRSKLQ